MNGNPFWTLKQARNFCEKLHVFLAPLGYDIGLAGGILFKGFSNKDIDIIIYPLKRKLCDFDTMYQSLLSFGLKYIRLPNANLGYEDDGKRVEIWEFEGKRVDLFFLS